MNSTNNTGYKAYKIESGYKKMFYFTEWKEFISIRISNMFFLIIHKVKALMNGRQLSKLLLGTEGVVYLSNFNLAGIFYCMYQSLCLISTIIST